MDATSPPVNHLIHLYIRSSFEAKLNLWCIVSGSTGPKWMSMPSICRYGHSIRSQNRPHPNRYNVGHSLKWYRQGKECARMNLNNQQDDAWSPNEVSQFINKYKVINTHLKSERSESDFNWRCVYILRTNENLCWQRWNFRDRNEVILVTETLPKPVSNCNLQHIHSKWGLSIFLKRIVIYIYPVASEELGLKNSNWTTRTHVDV